MSTKKLSVISSKIAEKEVNAWLDYKKVTDIAREDYESAIKAITTAVEDGILSINPETFEVTQKLQFEIKELSFTELKHAARLPSGSIRTDLKGIDVKDQVSRIRGYIKCSSKESYTKIDRMDTVDYNLASNLIVFFMT